MERRRFISAEHIIPAWIATYERVHNVLNIYTVPVLYRAHNCTLVADAPMYENGFKVHLPLAHVHSQPFLYRNFALA